MRSVLQVAAFCTAHGKRRQKRSSNRIMPLPEGPISFVKVELSRRLAESSASIWHSDIRQSLERKYPIRLSEATKSGPRWHTCQYDQICYLFATACTWL